MANPESRKLMVDVVARIDKLEKAMKKAAQVSDQQMGKVEKRARTMVVRLDSQFKELAATFGKGFLAGAGALGVGGIAAAIQNVTKSFADLGREAETAGINVKDFQRWRYVADQNRIGIDALTDGFKELNLRADEYVQTGKGSAAEAFQRLGMSPEEVKERLKNPADLMLELIDRTRRLKDTAAGVRIFDELLGGQGGEQFVRLIDQGRDGISATLREAEQMGAVFDENFIKRAEEIDKKFNQIATTVGSTLKGAIVDAVTALQGFISQFDAMNEKSIAGINAELDILTKRRAQLEAQAGTTEDTILGWIGKDAATELQSVNDQIARLNTELERRKAISTPAQTNSGGLGFTPITPPSTGKSDAEKARERATRQAERERKAVEELIAELQFEASLVGKSTVEKEKMTALRHAGAAATEEEKRQIESLVESTYRANEAFEKQKDRLEELKDAGREFAGTLADGLLNGAKASDVLSDALSRLGSRLLDSGLDALFSGSGGLLSGLLGGGKSDPWAGLRVPGYASGTNRARGGLSIVGERGPELVNLPRGAQVIPNDVLRSMANMPVSAPRVPSIPSATNNNNTTFSPTWNIDARGASVEAVARLEQVVARQQQEFAARVVQTVRNAQKTRNL